MQAIAQQSPIEKSSSLTAIFSIVCSAHFINHFQSAMLGVIYPLMMKELGMSYLAIASLASVNPFAGGAAYNASKFGLLGFSEAAMLDLRHDGIRMATVLPGSVATDFGHSHGNQEQSWMLAPEDVGSPHG